MMGALVVLVVALTGTAVGLFATAAIGAAIPERNALAQLPLYGGTGRPSDTAAPGDGLGARLLSAIGYVAAKRGLTGLVTARLERAGLPLRATEYMTLHLVLTVAAGLVPAALGMALPVSLACIAAATVAPIYVLEVLAHRRRAAFAEQLPEVLGLLAGSLRAGYGLMQAIDVVVAEVLPPASTAFARVQTETRLGLSVEEALSALAERLDSDDARWVVAAINIQREVGGNLAEVLDTVAETIREREALRRAVHALTAESRLSAVVLVLLPFVVAGAMLVIDPPYMMLLFTDPLGRVMCGVGLLLLIVGVVWVRKAARIEV
jgi:tight adherence protein B